MYVGNTVVLLQDGPLFEAGNRSGDKIVSVNDDKMLTQREIEDKISNAKLDKFIFEIERDGKVLELPVTIPYQERGNIGVAFGYSGEVMYVLPNSPAEKMGLETNDIVYAINGTEYQQITDLIGAIREIKNAPIELKVKKAETNEIVIVSGDTDVKIERMYSLACGVIEPNFIEGFKYAIDVTWFFFTATLKGTAEIFTGKTENVEVMGPVGIAEEITSTSTAYDFFYLMAAISLSLGIFNLIPIPALDGGRILILVIEGIRRKPLPEKAEQAIILIGFAAILALAITITISDVINIF
jgi:regulator of sigma E protease